VITPAHVIKEVVTFVFSTPERHWETKPLMKMGDFDVCNKNKSKE
jgi:hypothetical protein